MEIEDVDPELMDMAMDDNEPSQEIIIEQPEAEAEAEAELEIEAEIVIQEPVKKQEDIDQMALLEEAWGTMNYKVVKKVEIVPEPEAVKEVAVVQETD